MKNILYKNKYKGKKFKTILKYYQYNLTLGDIVAGIIKYQELTGFLVDIGDNIAAYLPYEEIHLNTRYYNQNITSLLYMIREFFLVAYNQTNKKSILSIKRLEYIRAWKRIRQLYLEDIIFNLKIHYMNKGGIITSIEGLQGFIPNSHKYMINYNISNLNSSTKCKLLIINEHKNEIILNQKSALLCLSKHKFRLGELIYGIIINIQNYGIFIDIQGILGLLHISQISVDYIPNIYHIFHINQLLKVKIIHINTKQGRLSVSKKNTY
uniref:Ribosomal protein S1 n=1 Tax=Bornetia secundiflora TaxID=2575637 RepID=A0A4D6WPP3_9FLOR|nr:ribosomal protein S1 [Bornetia secundiflora]